MNLSLLESKMKLFSDSYKELAKYLKITPQSLSAKKNGGVDFKQCEIMKIKERYKLTNEELNNIFFAN